MASILGQRVLRDEDPDLLAGRARFTADLTGGPLEGALHVAFVRSPHPRARIRSINTSAALEQPGVHAALHAGDLPKLSEGVFSTPLDPDHFHPLLPTDEARYAGQPVALVVAESAALAADAIEFIEIEFDELEPVLDLDQACEDSVLEATRYGTVESPLQPVGASSEVVLRQRFWNPRQSPAPIEARAIAATWDDGALHVWTATQRPHGFQAQLARLFSIDADRIHVTAPATGGGFGGKVSRTPEEHLIPVVARELGHPVRWNETRSEYFASSTQSRGEQIDLVLSGTADGTVTGLRVHLVKDGGAYSSVGPVLPEAYTKFVANGCYHIPSVRFSSVGVRTNRPPTSAFRGAGRGPQIAAVERMIDLYARQISMDPADVRRRNLIRPEAMPYETPTGAIYDEADYPADLETALDRIDYPAQRTEQAARIDRSGRHLLGIGIGCYNHMTTGGGGEEASVTIENDGTATVVTGSTSQGHGHATTWAQIASEVLGIPLASITVKEGSTDDIGSGQGAIGSRSLQTAGMAIHRAANTVLDTAREIAAQRLEAAVTDIVTSANGLHVAGTPALVVGWAELASEAKKRSEELTCGDFYDTEGRNTFPSGCHVAVVEVDRETCGVRILQYVAVDDAGTVVNPMIVEGQIHGGIVAGAAQVLGEVLAEDGHGNPITTNFADYSIATIDQFPLFDVVLSETASSFNSMGFKGVGESGTVGATAAVHNAIVDALHHLGVAHIDLPLTPVRIWEALTLADTASTHN